MPRGEGIQRDCILGFYCFQISNIIEGGDTPIIEAVDLSNYTSPTNPILFWINLIKPWFTVFFVILRQEVDTPLPATSRVKQLEFPSLWTETPRQNSRTIERGGWTLLRPHNSQPQVRRPPHPHMRRKALWRSKGSVLRDALPVCLFCRTILAKRCMGTPGRILRYTKYGLRTKRIKMIGQMKPRRNAPCKCESTTQQLSLSICPCAHIACTFFPPNKYYTCFSTFRLWGNSFLPSWRAGALTFDLVSGIRCSHRYDPASISDLDGAQVLLWATAGWSHPRSIWT